MSLQMWTLETWTTRTYNVTAQTLLGGGVAEAAKGWIKTTENQTRENPIKAWIYEIPEGMQS